MRDYAGDHQFQLFILYLRNPERQLAKVLNEKIIAPHPPRKNINFFYSL